MTLEAAGAAAAREADTTGRPQSVYRLKAWPAGVYGVRAKEQLPPEVEIVATVAPSFRVPVLEREPPAGMLF